MSNDGGLKVRVIVVVGGGSIDLDLATSTAGY